MRIKWEGDRKYFNIQHIKAFSDKLERERESLQYIYLFTLFTQYFSPKMTEL